MYIYQKIENIVRKKKINIYKKKDKCIQEKR